MERYILLLSSPVITSEDKGETWNPLGTRPEGDVTSLIVKDNGQDTVELYLALIEGVFYSHDIGVTWTPLNTGLENRKIYAMTLNQNVLFAGTDKGLFRFNIEPISDEKSC